MFVKFERTNLNAKPKGPIWISPDNVCTVEQARPSNVAKGPVTLLLTSAEVWVYVLGNVDETLNKLSEGS